MWRCKERREQRGAEGCLKVLLQLAYNINNFFAAAVGQRRGKMSGQGHSFNMNLHVRLTMAEQHSPEIPGDSVLAISFSLCGAVSFSFFSPA